MSRCVLKFDVSSYWHIGSGKGSDAIADAVVVRGANHLPLIPGRTIKGLLRDAMELASLSGRIARGNVEKWFGSRLPGQTDSERDTDFQQGQLEEGRFSTQEGLLWFGSATLPTDWQTWARSLGKSAATNEIISSLFTYMASTAIDRNGVAQDRSLRVTEVAVPMQLEAELRGPDADKTWIQDIRHALPLLRALGSRRSRGFGRVEVKLEERK